ncbi:MAG: DoxX family protein [Deltaproteobacteria bacterium]
MSNWKQAVWPEAPGARGSLGLLLLRGFAGAALMHHGWAKIQSPMRWMGTGPGTPPGVLQACAAVSEFFGGLGLIVGLLTPLAAFGVACTMAFAVYKHVSHGDAFVGHGRAYEPALGYLVTAALLMLAGPGRYALDAVVFKRDVRRR